jgi:hypothetical protein
MIRVVSEVVKEFVPLGSGESAFHDSFAGERGTMLERRGYRSEVHVDNGVSIEHLCVGAKDGHVAIGGLHVREGRPKVGFNMHLAIVSNTG